MIEISGDVMAIDSQKISSSANNSFLVSRLMFMSIIFTNVTRIMDYAIGVSSVIDGLRDFNWYETSVEMICMNIFVGDLCL
jgi:uncharacterized membrane protein